MKCYYGNMYTSASRIFKSVIESWKSHILRQLLEQDLDKYTTAGKMCVPQVHVHVQCTCECACYFVFPSPGRVGFFLIEVYTG